MEPEPSTLAQQGLFRNVVIDDEVESRPQGQGEVAQEPVEHIPPDWLPQLTLTVMWYSITGRSKVTHLPLNSMPSWDCTTGLHKRLVNRVFSDTERPASLTCSDYLQFNTSEECLNFPLDIARTTFRLVADHEGWQYVLHESRPHPSQTPGSPNFLHVVSVEFETVARIIGHLGIRMSMIAYPVVAIHKGMLQERVHEMRTNPNFKGIL